MSHHKYAGRMFPVSKLRTEMSEHMNQAYDIAMGYSVPLGLIERIADALAAAAADRMRVVDQHAAALAQVAELEQDVSERDALLDHRLERETEMERNLKAHIDELESQLAERDAQAAVSEVSIHNLIVRIRELERHFPYPEGSEDGE